MRVFIVETQAVCSAYIKEYVSGGSIAICENYNLQQELTAAGIRFRSRMDYLDPDEIDEMMRVSGQYQQQWYRYRDMTLFDGIHMGGLFNTSYQEIFTLLLFIELAARVIEREKPTELVVAESRLPVVRHITQAMGYQCKCTSPVKGVGARLLEMVVQNPYVKFLMAPRSMKNTILQIIDYLLPVPIKLMARGKGNRAMPPGSILVAVCDRNTLKIVEGVVKELLGRGQHVSFFVVNEDSGAVLHRMKANSFNDYVMPGDLLSPGLLMRFIRISRDMRSRWGRAVSDPEFMDSLMHMGVPILKYANIAKYKWIATRLVPFWATVSPRISDVISKRGVSLVLVAESRAAIGQIATSAADEFGIPSVDIQHGAFYGPWAVDRMPVSRLCVWGEWFRHEAEGYGVKTENTVVTGSPIHDSFYGWVPDRPALREKLGVPLKYDRVIMWGPSPEGLLYRSGEAVNERLLSAFIDIMREMQDVFLIVKLHPSEMPLRIMSMLEGSPENIIVLDQNRDIREGIYVSDIFISWNSTAISEAIALDKPVIAANIMPVNEWTPYIREGVAVPARTAGELKQAIEYILSDKDGIAGRLREARVRFVNKYFYKLDGQACERIADQVEDLITFHKKQ